jgi:tryptophanyl-tRNA synthetase
MIAALSPIRERALELQEEPERVDQILADGASTAQRIATETMREVRDRMGLLSSAPPALSARSQRHLES